MTPIQMTILIAAVKEAQRVGFRNVTREALAELTGKSPASITYHWGSVPELHEAIVSYAIETRSLRIIAQALAEKHAKALKLSAQLKHKAVQSIVTA